MLWRIVDDLIVLVRCEEPEFVAENTSAECRTDLQELLGPRKALGGKPEPSQLVSEVARRKILVGVLGIKTAAERVSSFLRDDVGDHVAVGRFGRTPACRHGNLGDIRLCDSKGDAATLHPVDGGGRHAVNREVRSCTAMGARPHVVHTAWRLRQRRTPHTGVSAAKD